MKLRFNFSEITSKEVDKIKSFSRKKKIHTCICGEDCEETKKRNQRLTDTEKEKGESTEKRQRESSPSEEDNGDGLRQCCLPKYDVAEMVGSSTKKKRNC